MKVLIYLEEKRLSPHGGPLGVGYYYHCEMEKRVDTDVSFLESNEKRYQIHSTGRRITEKLPKWMNNLHRTIRDILRLRKLFTSEDLGKGVDFSKFDIVHFHESQDMYRERKALRDYKGIVLFQSHSPLPSWMEKTADLPKVYFKCIPRLKEQYDAIDRYAFNRADYIIFPCEEAEEPYINNWPYYQNIKRDKSSHYKYVLTGIYPAFSKRDYTIVREELGIKGSDFVVCYVGRHNTVKGYDSLKVIGEKFVNNEDDNWIVVAGRLGPIQAPLMKQWIEIGWTTDAHSYIGASDVFILPNRVTYFDLVMIEVMSLGKIIVASRTGGNIFYEKNKAPGVFLYDTEDEAVSILMRIKKMPIQEREVLGKKNVEFYNKYLTASVMYETYKGKLKEIFEEQ